MPRGSRKKKKGLERDDIERNPQLDVKRQEVNLAIRRDQGVFGLARREALRADMKTGVLPLQLDCAEACSELADVMRNKDTDSFFSITCAGDYPNRVRVFRFPGYGNYDLLGVGCEDTILVPEEQVQRLLVCVMVGGLVRCVGLACREGTCRAASRNTVCNASLPHMAGEGDRNDSGLDAPSGACTPPLYGEDHLRSELQARLPRRGHQDDQPDLARE